MADENKIIDFANYNASESNGYPDPSEFKDWTYEARLVNPETGDTIIIMACPFEDFMSSVYKHAAEYPIGTDFGMKVVDELEAVSYSDVLKPSAPEQ